MNINVTSRDYNFLDRTRKTGSGNDAFQAKMMDGISEALSSGDMGQMFKAMVQMQMLQSVSSNPMMAPFMAKMFGMDAPATDKVDFEKMDMRSSTLDDLEDDKIDGNNSVADVEAPEIQKLDKKERAEAQTELFKKDKEQISLGGLDSETLKKITTVQKDGSVEVDLSKLDDETYKKLDEKGLNYSGSAALKIKAKDDKALQVNITGDANHVDLEGGNFAIDTKNEALQIKADAKTKINDIKGASLEHLVIKGQGGEVGNLDGLKKLEALKIENAKLKNGLNISSDSDIAVDLNKVELEVDKAIAIESKQDAQLKISGSKKVNNVNVTAAGTAIFEGAAGTKAGNITLAGAKTKAVANGLEANSIDVSKATEESGVFLSTGTKIKEGIKVNDALGKDKNEIILEDKDDKALTNIKVKNSAGEEIKDKEKINKREMNQGDIFKYLGWSEEKYKASLENKAQDAQPYGMQGYGPSMQGRGVFARALMGFAQGVNMYNQQYYGGGYNQMGMGYPQQQQYPWMQNNGFSFFG